MSEEDYYYIDYSQMPDPMSLAFDAQDKDPFEVEMDEWLGTLLDEPTVPNGTTLGKRSNFEGYGPKCCCGAEVAKTTHAFYCTKFVKY